MLGLTTAVSTPALASGAAAAHAASAQNVASAQDAGDVQPTGAHPTRRACAPSSQVGVASCLVLVRTDVAAHQGVQPADSPPAGYGPADLQSAYDLPSATSGSGQTVAVVDAYDDPAAEADLAVYRAQYGLPACTTGNGCFEKVNQEGQQSDYPPEDPTANSNWAVEESLDLDMVSAVCPDCHILLVEANDDTIQNLGIAVNEAVVLGAKFVSNSYGEAEISADPGYDTDYFDHPGVVITAAAGDSGYGVDYPAASQYVTAVGGTTLTQDTSSPRGWEETAWSDGGSGCSADDAKPSWQADTGCLNRTVADVAAVADPDTGVAIYDSGAGGWQEVGGTSVASPIIASVYALAGTPVPDTYPASYPYDHPTALNDVTAGSNGTCDPVYLCTAGPGYDGPTGLGTPDGVSAFALGPSGTVAGTVISARTRRPVPDAEVDVGTTVAHAGTDGRYVAVVPAGTYDVIARMPGYAQQTADGVAVGNGQDVTENFILQPAPSVPLTGTVTDSSGHDWPLLAKVLVLDGTASTYTDPVTGRYQLTVTADNSYRIEVAPLYQGYQPLVQNVTVGARSTTADVRLPVDSLACDAAGYAFSYLGSTQTFDGTSVPSGWTVVNNDGTTLGWEFDNPGDISNETGGSGGFAIAAAGYPNRVAEDTSLVSPVVNMSGDDSPVVQFDTDLPGVPGRTADVDVSIDGGSTWTTVWSNVGIPGVPGPATELVPLPQAAGQPDVQVRFHYIDSAGGEHWSLDNVFIGNRACNPTPGGLVVGTVSDGNTRAGIDGASITGAGVSATTGANPGDAALAHGFYAVFVTATGPQSFTASRGGYSSQTRGADIRANRANPVWFTLQAGRLTVSSPQLSFKLRSGQSATVPVTVANTGRLPVPVTVSEEDGPSATGEPAGAVNGPAGSATPAAGQPLRVRGSFSPLPAPETSGAPASAPAAAAPAQVTQPAGTWTDITGYPASVMGNGVATDTTTGTVYSVGGFNGYDSVRSGYTFDPATAQWTALPNMTYPRENPATAFVGGKLYVAGGWNAEFLSPTVTVPQTEVYQPASGTWSQAPSMPDPYAAGGVAVLNGLIYVIGGCDAENCGHTEVQIFDPATDTWTLGTPYPEPIAWESCGAVAGKIYCAGGVTDDTTSTTDAFSYDPATGAWTRIAAMPADLWGSGYTAANGLLLVSGGVTDDGATVTNQGFAYDPLSGSWSDLPDSGYTDYRGGSGCGFYRIGGSSGGFSPSQVAEQLPGYDLCGPVNLPWLSESQTQFTLQPGQRITIGVTVNAADSSISQPGLHTAALDLGNDTPYQVPAVAIQAVVRGRG